MLSNVNPVCPTLSLEALQARYRARALVAEAARLRLEHNTIVRHRRNFLLLTLLSLDEARQRLRALNGEFSTLSD